MRTWHVPEVLVTAFVDGECTGAEHEKVAAHLGDCAACRVRVEAEATASRILHAHAAAARRLGTVPAWRPRVWRLGRPALRIRRPLVLLTAALAVAVTVVLWPRPVHSSAIGVIGDSFCGHAHRFTTRFGVNEQECTLGCVERGADFVLITETAIYRIRNQELPALADFANRRVRVVGPADGHEITIVSLEAAP